jgi:hypothetical protein
MSHRSFSRQLFAGLLGLCAVSACSDAAGPIWPPLLARMDARGSEGRGAFQRYVAIGTSVSMGWASDGVLAASQEEAWPAQLARLAHRELTLPLIAGTGCQAPLRAPLISFARVDGSSAAAPRGTLPCAPNMHGVLLPTGNVALVGALARDALFTTPETTTDPDNGPAYPRVLGPGQTQVSAALSQNPKIVSIELGANEVLGARNGVAVPGVTLFPFSAWAPLYTQVVDQVAAATKYGLLVGLTDEVATFPGFRRGAELYEDRFTFAAGFNVTVADDCAGSPNLLFVPVRVPQAVGAGLQRRAAGLSPFVLSCAAHPSPVFQDYVLTPGETAVIDAQLGQMDRYIAAEAGRTGFAHMRLEVLYGRSDLKAPFSVATLMTTAAPYGPYISLDGIHPSSAGQRIIAEAAADALDGRYGFGTGSESLVSVR